MSSETDMHLKPFHKVGFENGSTALSTRPRGGVVGSIKKFIFGPMIPIVFFLAYSPIKVFVLHKNYVHTIFRSFSMAF